MVVFFKTKKKVHTVDEQEKQGYRFHNKNFINFQVLVCVKVYITLFPPSEMLGCQLGHRNVLWGH